MGGSKNLMKQMLGTSLTRGFTSVSNLTRGGTSVASKPSEAFIPPHKQTEAEDVQRLEEFLSPTKNLLVITGAGLSTESGIPDYRSEGVGLYATSSKRPVQHKTFMENSKARQSYWARNFIGWPRWSSFLPNIAHRTLYEWERKGRLRHIVTQNVDQLHYKAGSRSVTQLHGTTATITCMSCSFWTYRQAFQRTLEKVNPEMVERSLSWSKDVRSDGDVEDDIRPDGDVELSQEEVSTFQVPDCPKCGTGILKPAVVFFGDNVPKSRVEHVQREVSECDSLLVVGSSLTVFSSYRIITQARDLNKPIAIINIGATRADNMADLKLQARAGDLLNKVKLSPL